MTDREICKSAINIFGKDIQRHMLIEEFSELIIAINKHERSASPVSGYEQSIAEEVADVEVMLMQIKEMYLNHTAVDAWRRKKLDKLKSKLEG